MKKDKCLGRIVKPYLNPISNDEIPPYLWQHLIECSGGQPFGATLCSVYDANVNKLERDYSTSDLNSLVDQIANEFNLERNRVQDYFNRAKWSSLSKQLFNRIDMNQPINGYRAASLGGTIIKITKVNGVYYINCRKAFVSAKLQHSYWQVYLGQMQFIQAPIETWQALPPCALNYIYYELNSKIEGFLNVYKNI
ncbi:hypothetical protein TVAG_149390 [Trichomonas vaginalis G3]|uniref:Uncharacterized protein n=1 Tax=Trichomonas vaginalis (strain ATCC PRA-98 / G3) TaxID=412133 RepID=A2ELK6_TRIV3|nr:hypothetical protein TVAGG3_0163260 [Trichomonas vaginalis G3]EAY06453.1 hypothetical protein TVAG_149390 [Trichomonas vaginalis G3]KAI5548019.1 hypothetical protein TVAGG3_0163260 [Trichomonas vaginalis G3]|eukprot:XP_001318676.1 hypothetical protein [Trichomonas vaginalis G3]